MTTLKDLGGSRLADHVLADKLSDDHKVRVGDVGEVLVGAVLRKLRRYTGPILKLPQAPSKRTRKLNIGTALTVRLPHGGAGRGGGRTCSTMPRPLQMMGDRLVKRA